MAEQLGDAKQRTARKRHICDACGREIQTGQRYDGWAWADGGKVYSVRVHPFCGNVLDLDFDPVDDGFTEEFVPESLRGWSEDRFSRAVDDLTPEQVAFGRRLYDRVQGRGEVSRG